MLCFYIWMCAQERHNLAKLGLVLERNSLKEVQAGDMGGGMKN